MPERLRIALLMHSLNPRGGVVHSVSLAEALHDAGHRVTVIAPAQAGQRLFRPLRCTLETAPVGVPPADLAAMVEDRVDALVAMLSRRVAEEPFDVMHAQDSLTGNALATLRERGLIKGFMRTVHHLDHFDDPRVAAWQLRGFRHADQVLCVSRTWCDALRAQHGIDAALVHNGVDLDRYAPLLPARAGLAGREPRTGVPIAGHRVEAFIDARSIPDDDAAVARRLGLRPGAPMVLAVGGIEARKNTLRLIEAFIAFRRQRPEAQLVLAGGVSLLDHGAYVAACRATLATSGLQIGPGGDVVITGAVADADMPALFRLADAMAMPSLREGFGLVVLEAMASGTPVVVSRRAPFTEYLGDEDGHWADPEAVESIAGALVRACDATASTRARRLADGPPAVCLRHGWDASAARHLVLYRARRALSRVRVALHSH